MNRLKYSLFLVVALFCAAFTLSSCGDDDEDIDTKTSYDVIQINGENYACYGYRCPITFCSNWNLSNHSGELNLPCGKLSDAQKGEYDYDEYYTIYLSGSKDLTKGCNLVDFSPEFDNFPECSGLPYVSGSATVTDKVDDKYVTVKFSSFTFKKGSHSYVLNGTVQLDLDED